MTRTVKSYVSSCATCQRIKPSTQPPPGLLRPQDVPARPWSHISMDLITDLPDSMFNDRTYDSIVTFADMFSKQAHFVRVNKSITSKQLASIFLDTVVKLHGLPSVIVSDRDTRITADFWSTLIKSLGTTLNLSTANHPETDGQSEIVHRAVEQILRAFVHPLQDDWATWLPMAEFAYNSHVHSSTKQTPFFVNYGFHPSSPASFLSLPSSPDVANFLENIRDIQTTVARELDLAKARQAEQANRHRRELTFSVGDRVRLSTDNLTLADYPSSKLRPRFLGPFTVSRVISPVSYRLDLPIALSRLHPVFHVSRLLPWTSSDSAEFPDRPDPPQPLRDARDFIRGPDVYAVDRLLDVKMATDPESRARPKAPCLFFKVRWSPPYQSPDEDTWEPLRVLSKLDALRDFLATPVWVRKTSW